MFKAKNTRQSVALGLTFSSRKRRYSLPREPSGRADIWERSRVAKRILGRSLKAYEHHYNDEDAVHSIKSMLGDTSSIAVLCDTDIGIL